MLFTFNPIDKETVQANRLQLVTPGYYPAHIVDAQAARSKAGNSKMNLRIKIWDDNGVEKLIFTCLVNHEGFIYKTLNLCELTGLSENYRRGELDPELLKDKAIRGFAKVVIRKGNEKKYPDTGSYPDKNDIDDFVSHKPQAKKTVEDLMHLENNRPPVDDFDDGVPF